MPRARKPAVAPVASFASDMMDTHEVAAYLRLKQRRIYDLVAQNALPHVRATGKLLFPRAQIDAWLAGKSGMPAVRRESSAPLIIAGSHDPLLEWAVRDSGSGLAVLACGSSLGLEHFAEGKAVVAAMHWLDSATGEYNVPLVRQRLPGADVVAIEWAQRTQGLLLAPGNPLKIRTLRDVVRKRARVVARQPAAGSHRLFEHLLQREGIDRGALQWLPRPALAETDLAAAIQEGAADAGVAIEAAANAHGLAFIPLATERLDLLLLRRDYFDAPMQALLAFVRTRAFAARAGAMGGYDVTGCGRVVFNA